ncbi:cyclic nucleotide-binding domain-containing protein [Halobacteriovorax sp. GB3]|uniref:Crp/Fnr family transcriptional regulator n=1 Tax=Halobacteriovorax sp. GB3 TaxID=2719615 RepID=UPI002360B046|nr:cyclic nucleotide-binding domain-containing protein [Halobacteriovorax sp. GB3]MDD0853928.1 cyclic nucleotide-binding domain-containing protein [Halobacteriovorax sp. GB3]
MAGTPVKKTAAKKKAAASKKSGIRVLKPGETLFKQNDPAESLFIIQKGQLRLFLPKGRGFVELAILRAGEVLGEMAYFDEKSRRRSCSAQAIVTTEVIEISFNAFHKTIQNLNPWFRTIITTLADRLRKTNDRVKELESNSVGFAGSGKVADYKFFNNQDITRLLTVFYLTFKSHGEKKESGMWEVHLNRLKFYTFDIFNIQEIKFEEFFQIMQKGSFLDIVADDEGQPKHIQLKSPETLKGMLSFINSERLKEDAKKIVIGDRCLQLFSVFIDYYTKNPPGPTKDSAGKPLLAYPGRELRDGEVLCDMGEIIRIGEEQGIALNEGDLQDAVLAKLSDDVIVGDLNKKVAVINYGLIKKLYPAIKLQRMVDQVNLSKTNGAKY